MAPSPNPSRQGKRARGRELVRLGRSAWRAFRIRLRRGRRRGNQPASLAVFEVSELTELRNIFGDGAERHTVVAIRRALRRIDPIMGRLSRTTATSFSVLLPGYDAESALAAVRDALGESLSIDSDWHGEEIVVVPDFRIRSSSHASGSVKQLHALMLDEIAGEQKSVQRHRDYLRRERESHLPSTRAALP